MVSEANTELGQLQEKSAEEVVQAYRVQILGRSSVCCRHTRRGLGPMRLQMK